VVGNSRLIAGCAVGLLLMAREVHTEDIYEIGAPGNPGYYDSDHTTDTTVAAFAHVDTRMSRHWTLSAGSRVDRTRSEAADYASGRHRRRE
jgi:hypothetical protein